MGFLVPVDGDPSDLSTLLRWSTILDEASAIEAKHILFIMDACYSGLAFLRSLKHGTTRFLKDMLLRQSLQVVTAGKANQVVSDSGGPRPNHSIFTGHLLDALHGAAAVGGVLTASAVMFYVYQKVSQDPESEQTPHFGTVSGDGDFVFKHPPISHEEKADVDVLVSIPDWTSPSSHGEEGLAARLKTLLSTTEKRIELREEVTKQTRTAIAAISGGFPNNGTFSNEEFAERLANYDLILSPLVCAQLMLGHWSTELHLDTTRIAPKRLAELNTVTGGNTGWLALRFYPSLVLTYAMGLGSVAAQNYVAFIQLLNSPVAGNFNRPGSKFVDNLILNFYEVAGAFKSLPGHERQYAPVSEYLFKSLQPKTDDLLFLGTEYEETFDRVEMLLHLHCQHVSRYSPRGRYTWKHSNHLVGASPLNGIREEAETQGDAWPPLKAGLCGGSIQSLNTCLDSMVKQAGDLHW